jgi:hypothetical protein
MLSSATPRVACAQRERGRVLQGAPNIRSVPITVERDRQRNWLIATATGVISIEDVVHLLRTARHSVDLRMRPLLFDASAATTSMGDGDVETATAIVRDAFAATGPRGHVALVTADDRFYAWLLMYEIRCADAGIRFIRVFRQRQDAEQWLSVMSAARNLG